MKRRSDQLDPARARDAREGSRLLGRRRAGGGGDLVAFGRTTDGADEALKAAARDDQPSGPSIRGDEIGMGNAARRERGLAGAEGQVLAGDPQPQLAVEHVERLVLVAMKV